MNLRTATNNNIPNLPIKDEYENNQFKINNKTITKEQFAQIKDQLFIIQFSDDEMKRLLILIFENRNVSLNKIDEILITENLEIVDWDDIDIIVKWFRSCGVLS